MTRWWWVNNGSVLLPECRHSWMKQLNRMPVTIWVECRKMWGSFPEPLLIYILRRYFRVFLTTSIRAHFECFLEVDNIQNYTITGKNKMRKEWFKLSFRMPLFQSCMVYISISQPPGPVPVTGLKEFSAGLKKWLKVIFIYFYLTKQSQS